MTTFAVGIATRGRPLILKETLADLLHQTLQPAAVFVAYYEAADIGDAEAAFPAVHFLRGARSGGSCAQRNLLLDAVEAKYTLLLFIDDDCYLHRDYLLRMEETFASDSQVLGATGRLLLDGARGPGLTGEQARSTLRSLEKTPSLTEQPPQPAFNTHGSNMAFRLHAIDRLKHRFDEQMPGYAWFEDIDFSRRLFPFGKVVSVGGAVAVHLGAKVGKTSGKRFGYSQVANPLYLVRKGTYPVRHAAEIIVHNVAANAVGSIRPEPYIDRRGRLAGNLQAFADAFRGRLHPGRILEM